MAAEWTLEPHVCRFCLSRIVANDAGTFRCSGCGVEAQSVRGRRPVAICGCGMRPSSKLKEHLKAFACGPNPARSPKSPAEYVILFAGAPAEPVGDPT